MNIHKVELSLEALIDLEIRSRAMATKNVYHDLMYHAEIEYLSEDTYLSLTNAVGDTLHGFIIDIQKKLYHYKDRNPRLIVALKNPNKNPEEITGGVNKIIEERFDRLPKIRA